jgi:general stress protein YciG
LAGPTVYLNKRDRNHLSIERRGIMAERSKRGFASMDREKQRLIASKGGKAAHAKGTAHEFTREEAVEAGRKGGKAAHIKGTAHRFNGQENAHPNGENPAASHEPAQGHAPAEAGQGPMEQPFSGPAAEPYLASSVG